MIDSHCHLDCDAFDADRVAVLARAVDAGVTDIIVPAVDERSWGRIAVLGERCHAAYGIHPVALPEMNPAEDDTVLERLEKLTAPMIAIGECGLDTTIDLQRAPMERQQHVLRSQLALAHRKKLPVVLHARGPDSYSKLLELLEAEPAGWSGVVHSYGGGTDLLRRFLTLPLFFGFAGPATYTNARKVRASIVAVPADRLLTETDAPDQTPEPHRPGRSEPAYVADVIRGLAAARESTPEAIEALTTANARSLFGI